MATHFRHNHSESISEGQIPIFLDICEQPIGLHEITACLLCPEESSLLRLQTHIAEHMEEIALFVLSNDVEDNEDAGSEKAAGFLSHAAENTSQNPSSHSSLGFSPIDDNTCPSQTSEAFARLLTMEEPSDAAKCLSWRLDAQNETVLGTEHPDAGISMNDLATVLSDLDKYEQAEEKRRRGQIKELEVQKQEIETLKSALGVEYPDRLAGTGKMRWKYKILEDLFVQVIETRKRLIGEKHPSTLTSMAKLASTYRNQRRWEEAEELFVQVIETQKRVLGEEHPDTLTSMAELALMSSNPEACYPTVLNNISEE